MEDETLKNLMEELGLPEYCFMALTSNDIVFCSTSSGIKPLSVFLKPIVDEALSIHGENYIVYHVISSNLFGCNIVDCLLYPKDASNAAELLKQAEKGYVLSYCKNYNKLSFSETTDIYVKFIPKINSLKRY